MKADSIVHIYPGGRSMALDCLLMRYEVFTAIMILVAVGALVQIATTQWCRHKYAGTMIDMESSIGTLKEFFPEGRYTVTMIHRERGIVLLEEARNGMKRYCMFRRGLPVELDVTRHTLVDMYYGEMEITDRDSLPGLCWKRLC